MRTPVSLLILGISLLLLSPSSVEAQVDPTREGLNGAALCGLVSTAFPTCPKRVALAATGGYGFTESMGPVSGTHHRLGGALAVGVVPLPWLALALHLDGRIDLHPDDALGSDKTAVGDPRVVVRMGHALGERLSLGGEAVVWFPGADAPSLEPKATTVDLRALLAHRFPKLALLIAAGARIDQSAAIAPDRTRLRPGDRIALGLSDFHAVLIALGLSGRVGGASELFGEVGVDLLVGSDAPAFAESPLRLALGVRQFFSPRLQGELVAKASLSQRPDVAAIAALVPIEPRFGVSVGLRYGFVTLAPKAEPLPEPEVVKPPEPTTAQVAGVLHDADGEALPDVRVVLRSGGATLETVTDGEGRYAFADVPVGSAALEASAPGFGTERWQVEVRPRMEPAPARALTAKADVGTLRVLTRTFTSEPLAASVLVSEPSGRKVGDGRSDASGRFELELRPGRYVVTISAPGYRPHRRDVQIERYGVAIMNVDMRGMQ